MCEAPYNKKGLRTRFKDGKWMVPSINIKKRAMETRQPRKWMDNVHEDMEKKISFPTTWPAYKTAASSSFKNDVREKKEVRVRHAACMVYGLISLQIRLGTICIIVLVSVSCSSLLFCDFTLLYLQCCLHRVLRFFPFYPLNVAIDCFIILDKVFLT